KNDMRAGDLHVGAERLARAVLVSDQTEQDLAILEEDLLPAHFDLVRKKMANIERICNANNN
ncbi:hypothetical protein PMAYCL1PPCAC_19553, partial [Pristionchus mayeri]